MPELTKKKARSILKEGKKDHGEDFDPVYEGDIPDDEKKMVEDAEELVELAEQAKEGGQDHPAIDKILFLADVDGGTSSDPNEDEDEGEDGDEELEEPWDGYDSSKIKEILGELPDLSAEELSEVYEYEQANKNRDKLIAAMDEIAEEMEDGDDEDEDEDDDDYIPWRSYDEDSPKSIINQINGMQAEDENFFQNILNYEEENEDRARIKAVLEEIIEELAGEGESEDEDEDSEESGDDDDTLTREALEEMDLDELKEVIKLNELKMRVSSKTTVKALRVKIADALELEWEDEDEEGDEEPQASEADDAEAAEEDPDLDAEAEGIDWETLEQLELAELKELIAEKDLGMRAGPKTDLDKLRLKIAEALEIKIPASEPWRGYDKRDQKQILKKLPKLDDDELGEVFEYESENKARKGIIKKLEELAEERGLTDASSDEEEEEEGEGSEGAVDTDAEDDSEAEAGKSSRKRRRNEAESSSEDGRDHLDLIEEITKRVDEEHLSVPQKPPKEIVTLPFDLTELSDKELRQMHSAFLSYFGRAAYVAKVEKQLSIACKHIADDREGTVIDELDKVDPETEKPKTATQLKAEAEQDEEVALWRKRERSHKAIYESMKDDCVIYSQNLESLSREWTMRSEEIDHSGGLAMRKGKGKKSRKGS